MSKQDTAKNVVVGLAVGLVAGYVAGILTAPKSGKETRQDIKDATDRAVKLAQEKIHALQAQVSVLVDQARAKAQNLSARGKKELDTLVENAQDAQYKAKAILAAVKDGEADDPELRRAVENANEAKDALANFLKEN
ncbi:MAG: YtxH domain-containing protein [Candidatus Saccharimonadales bacterium]